MDHLTNEHDQGCFLGVTSIKITLQITQLDKQEMNKPYVYITETSNEE